MDQGIYVTFATDGSTNIFILFEKYTMDQNQKVCAFQDFMLDCVQKVTDLAWRED
jgi:hypothetical protein